MRDRRIKAEFWLDEKISLLTPVARLLYIALWNFSDDKGRCKGSAQYLWHTVFPFDKETTITDVENAVRSLESQKRIVRYKANGESFICVPRLLSHQYIMKPGRSRIPGPPESKLAALGIPNVLVEELVDDNPWTGRKEEREPDDGKSEKREAINASAKKVFAFWKYVMKKGARVVMSADRKRRIVARLNAGSTEDDLRKAVLGCRLSPFHMGCNDEGKVYNDIELIARTAVKVDNFRETFEAWASINDYDKDVVDKAVVLAIMAVDMSPAGKESKTGVSLFGMED